MPSVKRLEFVVDAPHSTRVTDLLERHGVASWTTVRGASGSSERGKQYGDEITGVSNNHLILAACAPDQAEALLADVQKFLTRYGGTCLVSDAQLLRGQDSA